jgi:hypothetical protein
MRAITKFVALDGAEFNDKDECVTYEQVCEEIAVIMSSLEPCNVRGSDFVQQSGPVFLGVQRALVLVYERLYPRMKDHHTEWAREATRNAGQTLIGRYINDCGNRPLRAAWHRIMCTDHKFREYEQPYYAYPPTRMSRRSSKIKD